MASYAVRNPGSLMRLVYIDGRQAVTLVIAPRRKKRLSVTRAEMARTARLVAALRRSNR